MNQKDMAVYLSWPPNATVVQNNGIKVNGVWYCDAAGALLDHVGKRVELRRNPALVNQGLVFFADKSDPLPVEALTGIELTKCMLARRRNRRRKGKIQEALKAFFACAPPVGLTLAATVDRGTHTPRKETTMSHSILQLTNTNRILELCETATHRASLAVIAGPAGTGKSTGVGEFNPTDRKVIRLCLSPRVEDAQSFICALAQVAQVFGETAWWRLEAVVKSLASTNAVLIIDEATGLKGQSLAVLKYIKEQACVPIILVGGPPLLTTLRESELVSHIAYALTLDLMGLNDTRRCARHVLGNVTEDFVRALHMETAGSMWVVFGLLEEVKETASEHLPTIQMLHDASEARCPPILRG